LGWHKEQAAVPVDHCLTFAKRVVGESDPRAKSPFGESYIAWSRGRKDWSYIEVLCSIVAFTPGCAVVIAQTQIKGKSASDAPVILKVDRPVGVPDSHKSGEPDLLQDERRIVLQIGNAAKREGLLRPQPFVQTIDTNVRAEFKRM